MNFHHDQNRSTDIMGGHGHHHEPYKVPDYKIYKVDKTVPELLEVEAALARHGLKDPWMR